MQAKKTVKKTEGLVWHNPREKLWGFHVHQELPWEQFALALIIQKNCAEFLQKNTIKIDNDDAIKPGYGPHLNYMWELRVETAQNQVLEKMGLAICYMAINRFKTSAYIHPLMHDQSYPDEEALAAEGRENQTNALWFGHRVPQNQDFFFNPPKDKHNQLIDTRTQRIMSAAEKQQLLSGIKQSPPSFNEPEQVIVNGFHIHMDFSTHEEALALAIFEQFLVYLLAENLLPTSTRLYQARENGPHLSGGWEVKFETNDTSIFTKIGIAIGWLMCNRQGLSVFMHPVTWQEGDFHEELKAHKEYSFFLGYLPELDLGFFLNETRTCQA